MNKEVVDKGKHRVVEGVCNYYFGIFEVILSG